MYVVRRAFRNFGKVITPGSIVEPGNIKHFKFRLNDGHIMEVPEQDFNKWSEYFKVRFGVEIAATGGLVEGPANLTGDEPDKEPDKEPEKVKPAEPIKVVKVVTPK